MLFLVTGGSGSGKSEYAEQLAMEQKKKSDGGRLYYVATMYPYKDDCGNSDKETDNRIKRHRRLRQNKGFITIERYTDIAGLFFDSHDVILLECMSNLLANEMYLDTGSVHNKGDEQEFIIAPLLELSYRVDSLIVVTNEVFSDGRFGDYDESTQRYVECLGAINRKLAEMSERVVEVCCGIPIYLNKK